MLLHLDCDSVFSHCGKYPTKLCCFWENGKIVNKGVDFSSWKLLFVCFFLFFPGWTTATPPFWQIPELTCSLMVGWRSPMSLTTMRVSTPALYRTPTCQSVQSWKCSVSETHTHTHTYPACPLATDVICTSNSLPQHWMSPCFLHQTEQWSCHLHKL